MPGAQKPNPNQAYYHFFAVKNLTTDLAYWTINDAYWPILFYSISQNGMKTVKKWAKPTINDARRPK